MIPCCEKLGVHATSVSDPQRCRISSPKTHEGVLAPNCTQHTADHCCAQTRTVLVNPFVIEPSCHPELCLHCLCGNVSKVGKMESPQPFRGVFQAELAANLSTEVVQSLTGA